MAPSSSPISTPPRSTKSSPASSPSARLCSACSRRSGRRAEVSKRLTPTARALRRRMTDAELLLIGDAVADFACRSAKLVVEVDGGQHEVGNEADAARTCTIEAHGYRVIRYWNSEVMSNLDGVLEYIAKHLRIASNE